MGWNPPPPPRVSGFELPPDFAREPDCIGCGAPPELGPACSYCRRPTLRAIAAQASRPTDNWYDVTTHSDREPQFVNARTGERRAALRSPTGGWM